MVVEEVIRIAIGLYLLFGASGLVQIVLKVKNFGLTPIEKSDNARGQNETKSESHPR